MDYNFTIKWQAGKMNLIADALSRSPGPSTDGGDEPVLQVRACFLAPKAISDTIINAANSCQSYQAIREAIRTHLMPNEIPMRPPSKDSEGKVE